MTQELIANIIGIIIYVTMVFDNPIRRAICNEIDKIEEEFTIIKNRK